MGRIRGPGGMPWLPELFSDRCCRTAGNWRHELVTVPFFDGVLAGEFDALVGSFAGGRIHHPVRGRIRGARAFEAYVVETNAWLRQRNVSVENVEHVVAERRGFGEVVLHLDGGSGRVDVPVAIVAEKQSDGRIAELRMYFSSWPLRPPREPPTSAAARPGAARPRFVARYQRALSAGDVDAIVATFEPDGYAREPAGGQYVHRGPDGLRAFYELLFSNDGGIPLEHCAVIDDKRACALEYNVVRWGKTELPPRQGSRCTSGSKREARCGPHLRRRQIRRSVHVLR